MSAKKTRRKEENRKQQQQEEQALPQQEVARFFREIGERAWTDAEKELDAIRQKSNPGEWSQGYVKGLEGILLSFKSGEDKYIFLPRFLQSSTPPNVADLKNEFAEFSRNEIHGAYDRGFFRSLEDYLTLRPSAENQHALTQPVQAQTGSVASKEELDE